MSKRFCCVALSAFLVGAFGATAEAKVDAGIVPSLYDQDTKASVSGSQKSAKKQSSAKQGQWARKQRYTGKRRSNTNYARSTVAPVAVERVSASQSQPDPNFKARSVVAEARASRGGDGRGCLQPQARALLDRIEAQFGAVSIVSTCRPGAVIAGSGKPSKHRYGLAVDFDAGGRKGAIVNWLIANHHAGGTMTYARMSHIHVDIGPKFVSLGSGGGRRRG